MAINEMAVQGGGGCAGKQVSGPARNPQYHATCWNILDNSLSDLHADSQSSQLAVFLL